MVNCRAMLESPGVAGAENSFSEVSALGFDNPMMDVFQIHSHNSSSIINGPEGPNTALRRHQEMASSRMLFPSQSVSTAELHLDISSSIAQFTHIEATSELWHIDREDETFK